MGAVVVRRRRSRAAAAIGALLALPACGALEFRSTVPRVAVDPDLQVSVEELTVVKPLQPGSDGQLGVQLGAEIAARPGAAWGAPRLGAAARRPCEAGLIATGDTTFTPGGPAQRTVLLFAAPAAGRAAPFADGTAVLDVPVFPADRTQPGRCLRVPLQSGGGGTAWRGHPWLVGLGLRVAFLARPLRGYEGSALIFDLPMGSWIGSWRLSVGFAAGVIDERGVAPASPPASTSPSVGLLGADAQLGRMLWSGRRLGLDAELGYDLLFTVAPDAQAEPAESAAYEAAVLHGPRVSLHVLGLMSVRPDWPGFAAPPDTTTVGLSGFAALWWQSNGAAAPVPVFGFSLDGHVGL
jgi:hypothetical protein